MKRFWDKVDKHGPDECWEWTASKWWNGYGVFYISRGRRVKAHRFSWELKNGPIPEGALILHGCDNPACVNPRHLRPGTQAENVKDRDSRGRHVALKGANNGMTKLSRRDVKVIRSHTGIISQYYLARVFGVAQSTIGRCQRGQCHT